MSKRKTPKAQRRQANAVSVAARWDIKRNLISQGHKILKNAAQAKYLSEQGAVCKKVMVDNYAIHYQEGGS